MSWTGIFSWMMSLNRFNGELTCSTFCPSNIDTVEGINTTSIQSPCYINRYISFRNDTSDGYDVPWIYRFVTKRKRMNLGWYYKGETVVLYMKHTRMQLKWQLIPLTFRYAECIATPTRFWAMQVNSPEWCAWAESIVSKLFLRVVLAVSMPSMGVNCRPFKVHVIFNGKSPLAIIQVIEATSPELIASSPNENGWIWGGTEKYLSYNGGYSIYPV